MLRELIGKTAGEVKEWRQQRYLEAIAAHLSGTITREVMESVCEWAQEQEQLWVIAHAEGLIRDGKCGS